MGTGTEVGVRARGSLFRVAGRLVVAVCLLALVAAAVPAAASELPEGDDAQAQVRSEGEWRVAPDDTSNRKSGLWFWPEGRRIYQAVGARLAAFDSETMAMVAEPMLSPGLWNGSGFTSHGFRHLAAVDRAQGRVFAAYGTIAQNIVNVGQTGLNVCPTTATLVSAWECFGGLHVLEGQSLESLGRIRLEPPTLEGPRAAVILRALEYAPPEPEKGWSGRVLAVVEEVSHSIIEDTVANAFAVQAQNVNARRNGANIAYAISFDPDSMRQEWAVRLEGCRNAREARNWIYSNVGDPAAIFRVGGADPAVYVGCHGNSAQQGVVVRVPLDGEGFPAPLPVRVGDPGRQVDPAAADGGLGGLAGLAPRQEVFPGPEKVTGIVADPVSRRILMRVNDAGEVWWVFDGHSNQFLGTIGVGSYTISQVSYGLDVDTGRLYLRAPGGLYLADIRRTPLAQALVYPHLPGGGSGSPTSIGNPTSWWPLNVEPRAGGGKARLLETTPTSGWLGNVFRVLVDESAVSVDPVAGGGVVRTLDVDEVVGVTEATFDGTARGFGFRAVLIGGVEGAARVGLVDPVGVLRGVQQYRGTRNSTGAGGVSPGAANALVESVLPGPDPCSDVQREVVAAFVGPQFPAVVDASSSRGEAQPLLVDVRTREDVGAPVTRCGVRDWQEVWGAALFGRAPVSEPGVVWPFADARSSCTAASGEESGDSWADPVAGAFSSQVSCGEGEVGGWGQARGVGVESVSVASALSSFRIYRDASRGMVARVESIARGVDVAGVVRIDTVRGMAESWANGHAAVPPDEGEPVDATVSNPFNCVVERPAGTCFQRHIFGVRVAGGYGCGPCGDEGALIEGLNRGLGAYGFARFREPDPVLARGSDDGYVAAVTKKDKERFSDIVLNSDLLETMVPMLEVVRYAPHNRPDNSGQTTGSADYYATGTPPRGRQVYQFAGVEVSSSYGIQCLLVYDAAANTCGASKEDPGSIVVNLTDPDGKALAGGAFEVRQDADADGVVGLADALLADGACVTTDDGIGTCTFEDLQPGSYLVSQVAAPPGYGRVAEPYVVELASGEARTVAFQNTSNVSTVDVSVADEAGAPVSGAQFAVYPDADSDGKVAGDAKPAASCTTDAAGNCSMEVPAGSYVLVQTSAPAGLEPIEPVAFTFASGGQTAAVGVVNYPAGGVPAVGPAAAPVYSDPPAPVITETIEDYQPTDTQVADAPRVSIPEVVGGTIVRVVAAPGDALRLFARDPRQAAAWTATILLACLAVAAVRRRNQALTLTR